MPGHDLVSPPFDRPPKPADLERHLAVGEVPDDLLDPRLGELDVAGATWADVSKCNPSEPVSVLQVHGTVDVAIAYDGGTSPRLGAYPGAAASAATWADDDGCRADSLTTAGTLDLDSSLLGEETVVTRVDGCPDGVGVELWTLQGGNHNPAIRFADGSRPLSAGIMEWLFTHPKP